MECADVMTDRCGDAESLLRPAAAEAAATAAPPRAL